ncbi:unnamed protein product [Calypogeia fissa]
MASISLPLLSAFPLNPFCNTRSSVRIPPLRLPSFPASGCKSFGSEWGRFPESRICSRSMNTMTIPSAVAKDKSNSVEMPAPRDSTQEDFPSQSPDPIPVLSLAEVTTRLQEFSLPKGKRCGAMYSSVVGGITLDPAAMVVPLDDHMVHRGHAVFDTATIFDGHLYELDVHLDRLLRSASKAKLTPPFPRSVLRDILVQTVAASGCTEGTLRYWLSAGPGGFGLSPTECERESFYAVVITERHKGPVDGVKVITSSIPIKPPQFATMKSTNYLPNAQVLMEAEENGAFQGIWLDQEGFVAEAANMNVCFVSGGELLLPAFANILSGCTAKRLLILAQQLISKQGASDGLLKGIKEAKITVEEGKAADEMMLVVSSYLVIPVVEWDGQPIGKGTVGPVTKALLSLLEKDVFEGPPEVREPVPYRR